VPGRKALKFSRLTSGPRGSLIRYEHKGRLCFELKGRVRDKAPQKGETRTVEEQEYYTLAQAAQVLGITQRRLLEMLAARDIDGEQDPQSSRWKISKDAVHEFVPEPLPVDQPLTGPEDTAELPPETFQELIGELDNLQREIGRLKTRLELAQRAQNSAWQEERELLRGKLEQEHEERRRESERAESTLLAEQDRLLEDQRREQERADVLQEEADRLREETDRLREELEVEQSRGSWRKRLFGG
jgi:excisionase family DNA binding protein